MDLGSVGLDRSYCRLFRILTCRCMVSVSKQDLCFINHFPNLFLRGFVFHFFFYCCSSTVVSIYMDFLKVGVL